MLKDLEKAIGYQFRNISLLQNALTHSSYANERWHNSLLSNERLEFPWMPSRVPASNTAIW